MTKTSGQFSVRCCIAGGGPAGMMAGLLLARAGVDVLVLEKHADFLRDFRGDTIHPSTLEVMHELGLADQLLKLPHEKVRSLSFQVGDRILPIADFAQLQVRHPYIVIMPQWDFLNCLSAAGGRYTEFNLMMETEAVDFIRSDGKISGVRAKTTNGEIEVHADLVIGADGRDSRLRDRAELPVTKLGAPMDVLWFRISRDKGDPGDVLARIGPGRALILIDRGDYWQCGGIIRKGSFEQIRGRSIETFRRQISDLAPFLRGRVQELESWEQIKLLTVTVDRLVQWYRPGFLCIGDAAHAMSPAGGIGINLAIQDAVAAANILAEPLRERSINIEHLRSVQGRRQLPTRLTQMLQVIMQNRILQPILDSDTQPGPPWPLRLLARFPRLRRLPAHAIGIGFRPEHVNTRTASGRGGRAQRRRRHAQKNA